MMTNFEKIKNMSIDELTDFLLQDGSTIEEYEKCVELNSIMVLNLPFEERLNLDNRTDKEIIKAWLLSECKIKDKDENNDLKLHDFNFNADNNEIDFSLSGYPAKVFITTLINFFKQNSKGNFISITVNDNENNKYSITIENCNGKNSVAEKFKDLENENIKLKNRLEKREALIQSLHDDLSLIKNGGGNNND